MVSPCSLTGKRLLVTGGAGFIGSHLVSRLISARADVTVLTKGGSSLWRLNDLDGGYRLTVADITDEAAVSSVFSGTRPEGVFHLAAYGMNSSQQNISQAVNVNVNGMINILNAMTVCGCKRIITIGSGSEYGNHEGPISEDTPLRPENPYASTKAAAAIIAHQYAAQNGIGIVTLRPFGIYGEAEPRHKLFCHVILSMLRGETLNLTPCTQCRDYCYVGDIVDAILLAYQNDELHDTVINIGTGSVRPLRDYIEQIRDIIKPRGEIRFGALSFRKNEIWSPFPDIRLATTILKWRSAHSLEEGLEKTINWYRNYGRHYE